MKIWLLDPTVMRAMDAAPAPTAQQLREFMAAASASGAGDASKVMIVAGRTARINVLGVLTERPDWFAAYFGGGNTTFGDVSAAISAVEQDPNVDDVEFYFNSPGGEARPTVALGDQIFAMKKPNTALVANAASAAYWLASQADAIVAENRAATVGSIGVVVSMRRPSQSMIVDVTSTNAENKRPDPETEEGVASIRAQIDPMAELFATAIAAGRDTTVEKVNNEFGRGGMLIAQQALNVGMIDAIAATGATTKPKNGKPGVKAMDLEKLKAEHPAVYAQAVAVGQAEGQAAERDRVKYHLTLGQRVGAEAMAITACLEGKGKDDGELMAEYVAAGACKSNLSDRRKDESELQGNDPAHASEEARVAAAAAKIFGVGE